MVASTGLSICLCKTLAKRTTFKLFKLQDRFLIIFVEPWPFGYYDQQVTMTHPYFGPWQSYLQKQKAEAIRFVVDIHSPQRMNMNLKTFSIESSSDQ